MASESFTIELPGDLAAKVHAKVATGEYASESEVIQNGLEVLWEDEAALPSGPVWDAWVRDQLRPAIAAYEADPTRGIPVAEVRRHLDELYAQHRADG